MLRRFDFLSAVVTLGCALFLASCAQPSTNNPPTCGTGEVLQGGACVCQSGLLRCNNACVSSDTSHCGSCTNVCAQGQVCSNGTCSSSCPSNQTQCPSGACVNINGSDPLNCGGCGTACPGGASCNSGQCACPSGGTVCGGACCTGTCNNGVCQTTSGTAGTTGGAGTTGAAGTTGSGGTTGSAGTTGAAGTTGSAGTTGGAGTTGSAGTTGGAGTTGSGGTTGVGGNRTCAVASPDVIADFEEGYGVMVRQGGRTGYFSTYADPTAGTQTPAKPPANMPETIAVEPGGVCAMNGFHSSATNHPMYVGFGASFVPAAPPSMQRSAYDVSQYDGIRFRARTGGGPASQPVFFEMLTKESQPAESGGTATVQTIDLYNTRGQILTVNSSTYTDFFVPFATLIPRWVPAVGSGNACPAAGAGVPKCQAAPFRPANVLGIQFSFYNDPGFPKPSPAGSYDLWIDDVAFYKRGTGINDLPALPASSGAMHAFPRDGSPGGNCIKPQGPSVGGRFLASAYAQWKSRFVQSAGGGFRVVSPEMNNDTVSEGIAYGMLISAYMNDKPLFDGLWTYWKQNCGVGSAPGCLMTWRIPGGSGSATDADEDAAFALLMAGKQWGGTYTSDGVAVARQVLASDIDSGNNVKGGSNYGSINPTNPSYFAPAFYRAFAAADSQNATRWNAVASQVYTLLGNISGTSSNGLYAAWCSNNCSDISQNSGSQNPATDVLYQYDSHRIPWRIGMDYCWYGTSQATSHLQKLSNFFANTAGRDGIGRIYDIYTPSNGREASGAAPNSASIIGTAATGAMYSATYQTFVNDAYQAVFDMVTRGLLAPPDTQGRTPYSYYNATVGLLTLLTLSGNFTLLQ